VRGWRISPKPIKKDRFIHPSIGPGGPRPRARKAVVVVAHAVAVAYDGLWGKWLEYHRRDVHEWDTHHGARAFVSERRSVVCPSTLFRQ